MNELLNDRKLWNEKKVEKLLLTVTVADPERFTTKSQPIIFTKAFVKLYNWGNFKQIHKIYKMVRLQKWRASTAKNPRNFDAHCIVKISSILHSAYIVCKDQEKFEFYVSNYIDWDQFNQLYDPDWLTKGIRNADAVA